MLDAGRTEVRRVKDLLGKVIGSEEDNSMNGSTTGAEGKKERARSALARRKK